MILLRPCLRKFLPDAPDVLAHDGWVALSIPSPYAFVDNIAIVHMSRSLAEQLHDIELRFGKCHLLGAIRAYHLDTTSTEVDCDIGVQARMCSSRYRPAILAHQVRAHALAQHIE